jgi:hypothetical protein
VVVVVAVVVFVVVVVVVFVVVFVVVAKRGFVPLLSSGFLDIRFLYFSLFSLSLLSLSLFFSLLLFFSSSDEWTVVSDLAKNLIKEMLNMDMEARPDAKECLQHDW